MGICGLEGKLCAHGPVLLLRMGDSMDGAGGKKKSHTITESGPLGGS